MAHAYLPQILTCATYETRLRAPVAHDNIKGFHLLLHKHISEQTMDQTAQSQQSQPETLLDKLSQSSHPIALVCYLFFKVVPLAIYVFGMLFTSNYILFFIIIILLLAADFWNVKNISGRLLVGLRWWNESNDVGETIWVFENADPQRYINPIDSYVFWLLSYVTPVVWTVFGILALLKFQFLSLILVGVAVSLNLTNTMAYSKCDKFGKANSLANDVISSFTGSIFQRINPLNSLFASR